MSKRLGMRRDSTVMSELGFEFHYTSTDMYTLTFRPSVQVSDASRPNFSEPLNFAIIQKKIYRPSRRVKNFPIDEHLVEMEQYFVCYNAGVSTS
jgi:hypothetical protein